MRTSDIIRNLRESRNLSQLEMSRRSGISQSTISAIEKGDRQPSMQMLEKLAEFFAVPTATLVRTAELDSEKFDQETVSLVLKNQKVREIFDRIRYMDDSELDVVLTLINALSRNKEQL